MEIELATKALKNEGFEVHSISSCSNGVSHHNFEVQLSNSRTPEPQRYVARFESDLGKSGGRRIDTVYGGTMSLEREKELCKLVREKAMLPAPEVLGPYTRTAVPFILAEYMPGKLWGEYLQQQNYSRKAYLDSLRLLGMDIGKAHSITFEVFGDVMGAHVDNGASNFSTRLEQVIQQNLQNNGDRYDKKELKLVQAYFTSSLKKLDTAMKDEKSALILADIHSNNFMVDNGGKPSGYFDLEFCQAAVPAVEMYNLSLQLFPLFNQEYFVEARSSFLKGYNAAGLDYDFEEPRNKLAEGLLAANHFFRAGAVYQKFTEGPRVGWADKFKDILFEIIEEGNIDYLGFKKTVRPQFPDQPSLP